MRKTLVATALTLGLAVVGATTSLTSAATAAAPWCAVNDPVPCTTDEQATAGAWLAVVMQRDQALADQGEVIAAQKAALAQRATRIARLRHLVREQRQLIRHLRAELREARAN